VKEEDKGWKPIESAPLDKRVLVNFAGAGPIVAFREAVLPDQWVRYIGYGKSRYWPTIHNDNATHWMPLPDPPQ
jgi:hypothetical protein